MSKLRIHDSHTELQIPPEDMEAQVKEGRLEEAETAHSKGLSWPVAALLQIGDIVGTGILALGAAVAFVGYVPAAFMLVAFLALNVYVGIILQKTFLLFPGGTSLPKMAKYTVGKTWFTILIKVLYYSFMVGVLGQYVQVLGSSLKAILVYVNICNWQFVLLSVVILLPFLQFRNLHESAALQVTNTISITLVVVISVLYMLIHMDQHTGNTAVFGSPSNWQDVFSSISKFVFAFNGSVIFLEFMAEMDRPQDFHKAFYLSAPYQLFMYALAAYTQYSFYGDTNNSGALIFKAIPQDNPLFGICAFLLFIHMICAYVIKGTVVARIIHVGIFPSSVNDSGRRGTFTWFGITSVLALFSFVISSSIPSFSALMDLLSSFQLAPLSFIVPPILLLSGRRKAKVGTSLPELVLLLSVVLLGIILTVLGSIQSISGAASSFSSEPPFYCHTS